MYLQWLKKYHLLIFDEIDSTNSEAMRLAKSCVEGDFIIWAKTQTHGRGTNGRKWYSGYGNLHLSILLDRNIEISKQPQISFVSGLALYDTVYKIARNTSSQHMIHLKWPNDVMLNCKKLSGILLESCTIGDKKYLIVGIGVNISSSPNNIDQDSTNLLSEVIRTTDDQVLNLLLGYFDKYFKLWQERGFIFLRQQWIKKAYKIHEVVTINNGASRISGIFQDIDVLGNICIKSAGGQIIKMNSGSLNF